MVRERTPAHGNPAKFWGQVLLLALTIWPYAEVRAAPTVLSCRGTVELMQEGKRANPEDEQRSIALFVDLEQKTLKIDDRAPWPITGNTSGAVIASMKLGVGSATLNRVTGAASIHSIESDGLLKFHGVCQSATKLF